MDETYVRVKDAWKYLYRAVDKARATVDFLLTAKRDRKAALRFLRKAIGQNGTPEKITIDKSGANTAAIESYNTEHEAGIEIRQIKYLNNIVEPDIGPSGGRSERCWASPDCMSHVRGSRMVASSTKRPIRPHLTSSGLTLELWPAGHPPGD